jgi:GWxTD domain-containing protein
MKRRGLQEIIISGIIIAFTLLTAGCTTTKTTVDPKDLSYIYNPLKNTINPRFSVQNQTGDLSTLSVRFNSADLFFSEANPAGIPMSMMFISVRLFNTSRGKILTDTAFYDLDIVRDTTKTGYLYKIPLNVEPGMTYVTDIKVMDKIRQRMVQSFVPFNTLSEYNQYNFYIRGHILKNEVLMPVVKKDEYFNIVYTRGPLDSIFINIYKPYEEFPYPPSMVLPEKPGATEPDTVIAVPYSENMPLMFPGKGIYYCSPARDINEGFSIFNFGKEFPDMNNPGDMIEPLAYLASQDEMAGLKASSKPKVALDDFWIMCGGNIEKARELIRIYYTRVIYTNYYFSTHKEGWRTDRGMIYIIYGPPDKLYKSNDEEKWGYRRPVVKSKWGSRYDVEDDYLYFIFKHRENRFSDNEYSLSRSETVVTYWDQAVLSWRKGNVFRLDNPEGL